MDRKLRSQINSLPRLQRAVFCACCCERLIPAFNWYTSDKEQYGLLRRALDDLWNSFSSGADPAHCADLAQQCLTLAPDLDVSPSEYASFGLNVVSAVVYCLQFMANGDGELPLHISDLTIATAEEWVDDMADSQEATDGFLKSLRGKPTAEIVEILSQHEGAKGRAISAHPIVKAEFERQQFDLAELSRSAEFSSNQVGEFKKRALKLSVIPSV